MQVGKRRSVGIDISKKTYTLAVIGTDGKVVMNEGLTTAEGRKALCKKLVASDKIALEAGNLAFIMAKEIIAVVGADVKVLNASKLALIYGSLKKTDKEDALKLARMMQMINDDLLPTVALPSDKEMYRRKLLGSYKREKKARAACINRLHGMFLQAGITTIVRKDLAKKAARDKAVTLLSGVEMQEAYRLIEHIALYEEGIKTLLAQIKSESEGDKNIELFQTVPGVGPLVAFAFAAYVGDATRFDNAAQVANYFGLVPKIAQSGEMCRYGRTTKAGNGYIRAMLVQAAWATIRTKKPNTLKLRYEYMTKMKGKGNKTTIIALARRIAGLMWTLMKRQEEYDERGFTPPPKEEKDTGAVLADEALKLAA
jgi:transposase